ncbi:MAG: sugar nucleotide-binding protein [Deltaproteobacteria bacterium]|nr:sugar nucleotide-binding protein [Deltaproteobacteria bacterium]
MNIVVAGGTGLVGRELLRQLTSRHDHNVTAIVRRSGALAPFTEVHEYPFAYDDPLAYQALELGTLPCDVLLIALGTTIREAGSQAAFRKVDLDYPVKLASAAAACNPKLIIGVVSSVGAARPSGFYLRTKHEMEQGLTALGVACVIARPSLLLGDRPERRLGEHLASKILPPLLNAVGRVGLAAKLTQYRPITASQVATALIREAVLKSPCGTVVIEGDEFYADRSAV